GLLVLLRLLFQLALARILSPRLDEFLGDGKGFGLAEGRARRVVGEFPAEADGSAAGGIDGDRVLLVLEWHEEPRLPQGRRDPVLVELLRGLEVPLLEQIGGGGRIRPVERDDGAAV